jgi:hypothetical protein
MSEHPYRSLPDQAFWRRSVANVAPGDVDPVGDFALKICPDTKVATAGSCFAQHIARYLKNSGYHYFVVEPGHPVLPDPVRAANSYGLFSARYGNIYTARQLWQLFQRAYGQFTPAEPAWQVAETVFIDPFRPTTQPGGYVSVAELEADRAQHLAAVRHMFETLDVFVFTLGLTETWRSRVDGAVFPLCPGTEGGQFCSDRYEFYNQPVSDVVADMAAFITAMQAVNPQAKIILTVSPVPLAATAEPGAHVLSATTYSKSVLRVAAGMLRQQFDDVHYFPSYEIITGAFNRGAYYAPDLRNVLETGVSHVMRLFMAHAADQGVTAPLPPSGGHKADAVDRRMELAAQLIEVECDEVALDRD